MWKDSIAELEHDIDQYREIDQDNLKRIAVLEAKLDAVVNCKLRTAYDKHGEVTEAFFSVNDVLKAAGFEERRSE
jgi:dTDP-4-dehydrorhamnose reductase